MCVFGRWGREDSGGWGTLIFCSKYCNYLGLSEKMTIF